MYKKQLFLVSFVYLSFLALLTSCNVIDAGALQSNQEIVPVAVVEENGAAVSQESAVVAQETGSMAEAETANSMNGSMSDNSMSGSNNMGGNNMMGGQAEEIPQITYFPDADIDSLQERDALEILVQDKSIARLLAGHPGWHVEMWTNEEEGLMEIDLFDADWEWIAWGGVGLGDNQQPTEVVGTYGPTPLTEAEYIAGQTMAEELALTDPSVIKALGDPSEWEYYTWYDEWEGAWEVGFYKGLDELGVRIENYDEEWYVSEIKNLALLDEEQQASDNQSRAIDLAWQKEGIDEALFGQNEDIEWLTVVTHIGGNEYGVSFVSEQEELFFALVDIEAEQVLE